MKTMTWILCAVFVSVGAAGWSTTRDPNRQALEQQIAWIQGAFPGHEGVLLVGQPTIRERSKPDGIGFANHHGHGVIWPTESKGGSPEGKFDDDDDCWEYIDQICRDAGHGGAVEASESIAEGSDGCAICSADCLEHGAVGFVVETGECSDDNAGPVS